MTYEQLKKEVIDKGLCTRCGSCAGLSSNIVMADSLGKCLPEKKGKVDGKWLMTACSGAEVPFDKLNKYIFGKQPKNAYIGNYIQGYVGHSLDKEIRQKSSSGGAITGIVCYLLEKKLIDGAIMLGPSKNPAEFTPRICRTRKQVMECAQSKYHISPVNTILSSLAKEKGKFAYVGIPCQIHSLRKLEMAGHPIVKKIKYFLGIYCGNILHFESVRSHLRRYGADEKDIETLNYREGNWPGKLQIKLRSGKKIAIPKFHANYLIPFYIMNRCLTCTDLTNEFTDISCGDGWSPDYEERGKGWSAIVARTNKGKKLLENMETDNKMLLVKKEDMELVNMHSHGLDLKKRGAFMRISFRRKFGKPYPKYNVKVPKFKTSRWILETVISSIFVVCSTKPARWLINRIPLKLIGFMFTKFRRIWISSTKHVKKSDLANQ